MDVIISHGHCPDGFCAALIAQRKYPEAEILFQDHGLEPPYEQVTGKDVVVFDFSWRTREQNDKMASLAKSFHIFDHHKTAETVLAGAPYATFDMKRSGAGLAWDYLFGVDSCDRRPTHNDGTVCDPASKCNWQNRSHSIAFVKRRPWWVNFIETRDLWTWSLPQAKEVCAYLGTLEFTKEAWAHLDSMKPEEAANLGKGALAHIEHYTREAVKQAQTGTLLGKKTAILNVPYLNCSEVGNALAQTHDVSLTWFERGDGMIQFSLRSIGDNDVSEIAKTFGGGGHHNASGFQMSLLQGRYLIDEALGRFDAYLKSQTARSAGGCAK